MTPDHQDADRCARIVAYHQFAPVRVAIIPAWLRLPTLPGYGPRRSRSERTAVGNPQ